MLPQHQQPQSHKPQMKVASLTPYSKQKENLLALAQQTDNPKIIATLIHASYATRFAIMSVDVPEDISKLIEVVGDWRMLLSSTKGVDAAQLILEAKYLMENYPELTVPDIKAAINLLMQQKLSIKLPYAIHFSTFFMGQVIEAYQVYKRAQLAKLNKVLPVEEQYKPQPKDRAESMKEIVTLCYQHVKADCADRFFNQDVYDYLCRSGALKKEMLSTKTIEAGKRYVQDKMTANIGGVKRCLHTLQRWQPQSLDALLNDPNTLRDRKLTESQHKIDFMLRWFFQINTLENILKKITPEHFAES
jgi:hypothetical protein